MGDMVSRPPTDFTTVKLSCACRQLRASIDIPSSALPLKLNLCHCDTCRHVTGLLCVTSINRPEGSKPLQVEGEAQVYHTSPGLSRCFCGSCGTSVYEGSPDPSRIGLCSGALESAGNILELNSHLFVADTKDGGLRDWLPHMTAWEGEIGQSKEIPRSVIVVPTPGGEATSTVLHCRCHCGGVEFDITRPNAESMKAPKNAPVGTKYVAKICACNSCRLGSGYDINPWTFVPSFNIQQVNGDPLDLAMGTLKQYNSSEGVYRNFCRVCGAAVFWHSVAGEEKSVKVIDVSVGLLEAESGARAEDWLLWKVDKINYLDFAQNKPLFEHLALGMKEWGNQMNRT